MGDLAAGTVVKALACVVWAAWMLVMVSLAVHLVARMRHVVVRRPRLIPAFVFTATGRWLSGVTLAASTTVMSLNPAAYGAPRALSSVTATLDAASASAPVTTTPIGVGSNASSFTSTSMAGMSSTAASTRTWTVADGETLWEIAEATLGDGSRWNDVFEANRSVLASTDLLPVGTHLVIPTGVRSALPATAEPRQVPAATTTGHDGDDLSHIPVLGTVTVERGDHFWKLSTIILTQAYGRTPTRHELDHYWRNMVELNRDGVPSGNVNLIHPGEHYDVLLPELPDDVADRTVTLPHLVPRLDHPVEFPPAERSQAPVTEPAPTPDPTIPDSAPLPAPVTVAPTITTPVPLETSAPEQPGSDLPILALAGLGLSAVGAGAVLVALRRRRAAAARTRAIGEQLSAPTEDLLSLLHRLRAVAASDVTATVDATQRLLRHQLATQHLAVPSVLVARAGRNGVELLLDQPLTAVPTGFVAVDDGNCWVLSPNVTTDELDDARVTSTGLLPGLVSIGTNDVGTVLVDVERLAALEVRCDDLNVTGLGVLAAMAAEWEGAPWLDREEARLIGIGLPAELFDSFERLQLIADADTAATVGALVDAARNDAVRYPAGKHAERVTTDAMLFGPTIVLVGPGRDDEARMLAEAALLSGSGLCVVALSALPQGASQLVITGSAGVLEPFGLDLDQVVCLATEDAVAVGALIDASDDIEPSPGWPPAWQIDTEDAATINAWTSGLDIDGQSDDVDDEFHLDDDALADDEFGFDDGDPDDDWGTLEAVTVPPIDREALSDTDTTATLHELTTDEAATFEATTDETPAPPNTPAPPPVASSGPEPADLKFDDPDDDGPDDDGPNGLVPDNADEDCVEERADDASYARQLLAELSTPTSDVQLQMLAAPMPVLVGTGQGLTGRRTPRCTELLSFLVLRGPQSPARVLEALWPDKTDQRTAITATSRIRSAIAPATITLTDDRYGLDGVDSDWTRFGRMVTEAKTLDSSGAMVLLEGALSMVMCRPFEGRQVFDGRSSTWEWLDHGYVEADVLVRIVDAAEALAELALHAGDASKALWACEKARLMEPHREATHLLRMRAYALLGDRDSLHREVRHAHESATLDDPLAERSANVVSLMRVLDQRLNTVSISTETSPMGIEPFEDQVVGSR